MSQNKSTLQTFINIIRMWRLKVLSTSGLSMLSCKTTKCCEYQHTVCLRVCVVGEQLLQAGEVFSLHPLQLYSVSQQLRLAKPTCCNGDAKTDLGHILDFTCRLRYLKVTHLFIELKSPLCNFSIVSWPPFEVVIVLTCFVSVGQMSGTRGPVGTSNIQESSLPFDLSVFKSLLQIEVTVCLSVSPQNTPVCTVSAHSYHTQTSYLIMGQWTPAFHPFIPDCGPGLVPGK